MTRGAGRVDLIGRRSHPEWHEEFISLDEMCVMRKYGMTRGAGRVDLLGQRSHPSPQTLQT